MPETSATQRRPASTAARVGRVGMVGGGPLVGVLIVGTTLLVNIVVTRSLGPSAPSVAVVGVASVLIAGVPGFTLCRQRKVLLHRLGLGLCAGSGVAVVTLLAWGVSTGFDPTGMTRRQVHGALQRITTGNREAFYLGDEADGKRLAVITDMDGLIFFEYGRCFDTSEEEPCTRPLTVTSQPTSTFGSRGETSGGCTRLRPVLGVPAADLGDLTLFSGSSIITITDYEGAADGLVNNVSKEAALAQDLRAVGQSAAPAALSPPDADTRAFVDQRCGTAAK